MGLFFDSPAMYMEIGFLTGADARIKASFKSCKPQSQKEISSWVKKITSPSRARLYDMSKNLKRDWKHRDPAATEVTKDDEGKRTITILYFATLAKRPALECETITLPAIRREPLI